MIPLSWLSPYRYRLTAVFALMVTGNLAALVLPWALKILIDDLSAGRTDRLVVIPAGMSFVVILRGVVQYFRFVRNQLLGEQLAADIRQSIYFHVYKISVLQIKKLSAGKIFAGLTSDVETLRSFFVRDALEGIYALLSMILTLVILSGIDLKLTVFAFSLVPCVAIFYRQFLPQLEQRYRRNKSAQSEMLDRAHDALQNIFLIKAFSAEEKEKKLFKAKQEDLILSARSIHRLNSVLWSGVEMFAALCGVLVLWMGGAEMAKGRMSVGDLVAFYTYTGMLFMPAVRLSTTASAWQEVKAAYGRVREIMSQEEVVEPAALQLKGYILSGGIEMRGVTFAYGTSQPVLRSIDLTIAPGEKVAIVGQSGAGKTTLVNLLLKLFLPLSGEIRLDGHPLGSLAAADVRKQMAIVCQEEFLFNASVRENVLYGRPDATDKEVREALAVACAEDFVDAMPEGIDTPVKGLSFGQRQRIAIARAVIRKPAILILDEATSSVDAITENKIQEAIYKTFRDRTVIMIAHRFSTIVDADKIFVLNKGAVASEGTHAELLKTDALYGILYKEQFHRNDDVFCGA